MIFKARRHDGVETFSQTNLELEPPNPKTGGYVRTGIPLAVWEFDVRTHRLNQDFIRWPDSLVSFTLRESTHSLNLRLKACRDDALLWRGRFKNDHRAHVDVWLRALAQQSKPSCCFLNGKIQVGEFSLPR